jgi:hypothetical protein
MKPTTPIVLPRPNLGPEPWPSAPLWPWIAGAILVVVAVGIILLLRRRGRARRKGEVVSSPIEANGVAQATDEPADLVRSALLRAFGATWRARTTEEVAASTELEDRFGGEVAGRVVDYLRAVDRAKFSADPAGPSDELGWWAARFAEEVDSTPADGAAKVTSRINGK